MLKDIENYPTYQFFEFYCLLYRKNKKQHKITTIGYYPIFTTLNYIKYEMTYKLIGKNYFNLPTSAFRCMHPDEKLKYTTKIFEDNIEISCEAYVGIKIIFVNDPINTLKRVYNIFVSDVHRYIFLRKSIEKAFDERDVIFGRRSICGTAISCGHLNCLIYLHNIGCPLTSDAYLSAIHHNQLECLKYLHENRCPRHEDALEYAINYGNLECFGYLCYYVFPLNIEYCNKVVARGKIEFLRYLHVNMFPWNVKTCGIAAHNGQLECLKYLHENGCPFSHTIISCDKECQNYINTYMLPKKKCFCTC